MIPLSFIIFCIFIAVALVSELSTSTSTTLSPYEQIVVCPGELRDDDIKFTSPKAVATLHYTLPPISYSTNSSTKRISSQYIWYDDYKYWSFNLVKGSRLYWDINGGSDYFDFYLIKGYDTYKDFKNGYYVSYEVQRTDIRATNSSYVAATDDEYFIICEAYYYGITLNNLVFSVDHTRYQTEVNAEQTCDGSCTISVDDSKAWEACIIVENTGSVDTNVDVTYYAPFSVVFYACLVCAVIIGVLFAASLLGCIICACRKSTGSQGQTYNNLGTQPSYPAGNATPAAPSYQAGTTYSAVPPAYPGADPSYAQTSYGTAPPAY